MEESDEYEMELGQNRENALETEKSKKYFLKQFFHRVNIVEKLYYTLPSLFNGSQLKSGEGGA